MLLTSDNGLHEPLDYFKLQLPDESSSLFEVRKYKINHISSKILFLYL